MSDEKKPMITDLLGTAAVGRAVERVTDSVMSGAEAVLSRICLPASEEFGQFFRDKVSAFRQRNLAATMAKAQPMLEAAASENRNAPLRLIWESLNQASFIDDDEVQAMWAGLLASSCTEDGTDESNWVFINLVRQLTSVQARILRHACEASEKTVMPNGLISSGFGSLRRTAEELVQVTGCSDIHRLDRELDHLRSLGLIEMGFASHRLMGAEPPEADIRPTALALHMYVRCQGSLANPIDYFIPVNPANTEESGE